MGIQFGGLASGLNTGAIIDALVAARSRPIQLLQTQRDEEQNRISQVGVLENLVKSLEDKAQELTSLGGFFSYSVSSADDTAASFQVTGAVTPGQHTLDVQSLAAAARYAFEPTTTSTDPDAAQFGAGDITFTYDGTNYTASVAAGASLNEVATAITDAAGAAVTASVVNVGTASSPDYQLVVADNDTGADFDLVNLTVDPAIGLTTTSLTTAQNAVALVDNLRVERASNLFADVLPGLSFTALSTTPNGPVTFTSELDVDATKEKLQGFVDDYNAVVNFVNSQSSFSEDNGPGGVLFGDFLLGRVSSTLNQALFDPNLATVTGDTKGFSTLGLVGFDLQSDGTITIDDADFESKVTADPDAFKALFTDPTEGVLVKLDTALDGLLDGATLSSGTTLDNIFTGRRNALNAVIDGLDGQIERLQFNLDKFEESLVQRFANLESIVGGLNSQASFLSSNLSNGSP